MKKLYTILIAFFAFAGLQTNAQITPTSCNAGFTAQYLGQNTYWFHPVDSAVLAPSILIHSWNFGDASAFSTAINPTHTYTTAGTYLVQHTITRVTPPNTSAACTVTFTMTITIPPTIVCNLQAAYTKANVAGAILTQQFSNTSTNFSSADSIRWNFGDGTPTLSGVVNPVHSFANAGVYNVCLWVKKASNSPTVLPCVSEICKLDTVVAPTPVCNLQAYYTNDSAVNNIIHFTNQSGGYVAGDSITWNFGDGTISHDVNPVHTFANYGTYNVCLIVKKNPWPAGSTPCVNYFCKTITIAAPPCTLVANYIWYRDSLPTVANYTVHFTNTSTSYASSDSIRWSFGDGTYSNQVSPNHVYTTVGNYIVCLRIIKRGTNGVLLTNCISEKCSTVVVTAPVVPCTLVANYTWYRDTLPTVALNTVHFTNTSTSFASTDSIRWSFGDGTYSNQVNPVHSYATYGTYTVCLRIIKRGSNGVLLTNCVSEKCIVVTIPQVCNINASYTWHADSANYKNILFTNTTAVPSPNATAIWYFGDGTTATTWSSSHVYAQAGKYNVCLRVQYGTCVSYKCDSVSVIAPPPTPPTCTQISNYTFVRTGNSVSFSPTFAATGVNYVWTFGDGTSALGANVTHVYTTAGVYTACLTAYRNNTCGSTTCNSIQITSTSICGNITLGVNDIRDSLVPNRITFSVVSNTATISQQWTITKIPTTATTGTITINGNNPTYMFIDSGYYNVCVTATFAGGCVKTFCKTIHITQNLPGTNVCTLQAYPNPASNTVNAQVTLATPQTISASIYNSQNALVAQTQQQGVVGINTISINIAALSSGTYILRVVYGNQTCYASFVK